jgi:hypothetical protein
MTEITVIRKMTDASCGLFIVSVVSVLAYRSDAHIGWVCE